MKNEKGFLGVHEELNRMILRGRFMKWIARKFCKPVHHDHGMSEAFIAYEFYFEKFDLEKIQAMSKRLSLFKPTYEERNKE